MKDTHIGKIINGNEERSPQIIKLGLVKFFVLIIIILYIIENFKLNNYSYKSLNHKTKTVDIKIYTYINIVINVTVKILKCQYSKIVFLIFEV